MKKIISLVLMIFMLLSAVSCQPQTGGETQTDNNGSGDTSAGGIHTHADNTGDGACDICGVRIGYPACGGHTDSDGDGKCDSCARPYESEDVGGEDDGGEDVGGECTAHTDNNGDGRCDTCYIFLNVNACTTHSDANDDGRCDTCYASVVVVLDFYAINDLHGKFADTDQSVGVDELTTYLKNAYETDDNVVILSSGDMWQGSSESNLTHGAIITEWMNELDFVSMTLGNHEYDWSDEYIIQNAEIAQFPLLAINVYDKSANTPVDYCAPSVLVERDGVKIGIIGAIGDCYSSISQSMVEDVYFKTGSELTELVRAESERLRAAGAELIVYSLHDGYGSSSSEIEDMSAYSMSAYYDTALSAGYVDLVFEAHTHQSYIHIDNKGVYHFQGGGEGSGLSHVELELNIITDSIRVSAAEIVRSSSYSELEDDPIVAELLDKYSAEIEKANEYLGNNSAMRGEEYITDLVAELYYTAGVEKWGGEYDIALGGGYLNVRSPYFLAAGEVIYGDLMSILPFDNEIVLCSISGEKLKYKFFETSNSNYHIAYGEYGESIRNSIDLSATYYVIVDRYTLDYAPNGLTEVAVLEPGIYARDLLADYIRSGGMSDYTLTDIGYILELVGNMGEYNVKTQSFYIKGEIITVPDATYGNTTLRDESGDEIYVYGIYGSDGGKFNTIANQPSVGDTVVLYGPAMYYKNSTTGEMKIEITGATLVEISEN